MKAVYFVISILFVAVVVNLVRSPALLNHLKVPDLATLQGLAAATAGSSTDTSSLVNDCSKFLLMVEGDQARGSASVIKWRGNSLIVTNIHVLSGNSNPRFRLLSGQQLVPDTLGLPPDRDILVASQHQVQGGLEASTAVASEVAIGDEVVVLGNSLGSNVATEVKGKILGIGPDLIETDAKFVSGNSGSPIIHVKTGKVIAIATFATIRKLDDVSRDSQFATVRRFGYRFDTVAKWQFMTAKNFADESGLIGEIKQRNDDLFKMAKEAVQTRYIKGSHYSDQGWVRGVINAFCDAGYRDAVGEMKFEQAYKVFEERRGEDIRVAQQMKMIPYHQKELAEEIKARQVLDHFLEKINWNRVEFDR